MFCFIQEERVKEIEKPTAPTQEDIFGEELDVSSDEEEPVTQVKNVNFH